MKMKLIGLILGATFFAAPALAASVMSNEAHMFKMRGRMVEVHQMKMDDGSVVYAMSKSDLERVLNQRIRDFSTYAPQR